MSKDFSQQAEEQLQNAISSVEPCNDYEFTNYNRDGWCYYSEWINRLGLRNSINAVNSYQHKVTSKNENAKRKVSDIYEKAQSIDVRYGNIIAGLKDRVVQKKSCLNKLDLGLNYIFFPNYTEMGALESVEYLKKIDNDMSEQQDIMEKLQMLLYIISGTNKKTANFKSVNTVIIEILGCQVPRLIKPIKFPTNKWLVDTDDFMYTMESLLSRIRDINGKVSDSWYKVYIKNIESTIKTIAAIDKKTKKLDSSSMISNIASYVGTLCGIVDNKPKSGSEVISSWLKLGKSSIKVEKGIYDYFIKTLTPYEASKLGEKYGKGNIVLSAISSVAEIGENSVKMHDVMVDENSNAYDKVGQAINVGGSLADFYGKLKIAKMSGTKSLRIVNNLEGCSKGVKNQILATESSLKYTTAATVGKKISTAST